MRAGQSCGGAVCVMTTSVKCSKYPCSDVCLQQEHVCSPALLPMQARQQLQVPDLSLRQGSNGLLIHPNASTKVGVA